MKPIRYLLAFFSIVLMLSVTVQSQVMAEKATQTDNIYLMVDANDYQVITLVYGESLDFKIKNLLTEFPETEVIIIDMDIDAPSKVILDITCMVKHLKTFWPEVNRRNYNFIDKGKPSLKLKADVPVYYHTDFKKRYLIKHFLSRC